MQKKAILIVSFGTLVKESLENSIDVLIARVENEFSAYRIQNVFTSSFILNRLENRKDIVSLEKILLVLAQERYEEVIIQPTLLTVGEEYEHKILRVAARYQAQFARLSIGRPVLESIEDISALVIAFQAQAGTVDGDEEIVFMGHGLKAQRSDAYVKLQSAIDAVCANITVGVLEENDVPTFEQVLTRLKAKKRKKVYLMPLLFVAGMHVKKDMTEDDCSWRNRLCRAGLSVRVYDKGLGENKLFQDFYLAEIKKMIYSF